MYALKYLLVFLPFVGCGVSQTSGSLSDQNEVWNQRVAYKMHKTPDYDYYVYYEATSKKVIIGNILESHRVSEAELTKCMIAVDPDLGTAISDHIKGESKEIVLNATVEAESLFDDILGYCEESLNIAVVEKQLPQMLASLEDLKARHGQAQEQLNKVLSQYPKASIDDLRTVPEDLRESLLANQIPDIEEYDRVYREATRMQSRQEVLKKLISSSKERIDNKLPDSKSVLIKMFQG